MAMTALEKQTLRTALASRKHANSLITIIDSGTHAATLTTACKHCIQNAMANEQVAQSLIDAIQTGSALSERAKRQLRSIFGRKAIADGVITQINAIV